MSICTPAFAKSHKPAKEPEVKKTQEILKGREVEASWATGCLGTLDESLIDNGFAKRANVENSLGEPDLSLREVTRDGDTSRQVGEGVEVWAVNYNGTKKDKLIAIAYNKTAQTRLNEYNV